CHLHKSLGFVALQTLQILTGGCPSQRAAKIHIPPNFPFGCGRHRTWRALAKWLRGFRPPPLNNHPENNPTDRTGATRVGGRPSISNNFQCLNNSPIHESFPNRIRCVLSVFWPPNASRCL